MKVKIRNEIFDSRIEPIMIILSEQDKENISNMIPDNKKYCSYPNEYSIEEILNFMKE